jgi:hypothetical protein
MSSGQTARCNTGKRALSRTAQATDTNPYQRNRLQDVNDRKTINFNPELQQIFNVASTQFQHIPELLREHLSVPDPFTFYHTIMYAQCSRCHSRTVIKPFELHRLVDANGCVDAIACSTSGEPQEYAKSYEILFHEDVVRSEVISLDKQKHIQQLEAQVCSSML